jgi:hypothetical protein
MGLPQGLSLAALLLNPPLRIPSRALVSFSSLAVGPILGIPSISVGLLLLLGAPPFLVPCFVPVFPLPAILIGLLSGSTIPFFLTPFLGQIVADSGSANTALLAPFLSRVIPGRV